jgi:hypothetical protein
VPTIGVKFRARVPGELSTGVTVWQEEANSAMPQTAQARTRREKGFIKIIGKRMLKKEQLKSE